ncbi:hypothetical protein XH99_29865 [Bradyrhizobium nanningense]|uniref:Uncharacterized protein n=1 Tax=Bradyrhizobium nanningense TaxID=1325118 RepID=A0A4Q0RVY6_9BRAD|nr:hypothetical protein XH99_29865 [Bradyrhizobium nanningense]RXH31166.1 hypothetical protein XH84_15555 [Bradyrhizobium nanningense]TQF33817.1 hypothetical protein UNPA324_33075 [Bradyrhizobium sp. UNPA324]
MAGMRLVCREAARPAWFETPASGGLLTMRVSYLAKTKELQGGQRRDCAVPHGTEVVGTLRFAHPTILHVG